MESTISFRRLGLLATVLAFAPFLLAAGAPKGDELSKLEVVQEHTNPSATTEPTFMESGVVKNVLVKPGDVVHQGQILATEDADLEELKLKSMKILADSTAKVDAAIAERDMKKVVYENKKSSAELHAVTEMELQQAKLEFDEAEIQIRVYSEQGDQAAADVAGQERKIEKMKLLSPLDGIVEKINVNPGEIADPARPHGVMTLVRTQPLWVDFHVKSAKAAKLKLGQTLWASYVNEPDKWIAGTVIYFDPVVNATVDEQVVRLELKNDEGKPAGWMVNVRLPWPADSGVDEADRTAIGR
ncbi:MAG: efflux RND transporter periplasmic adaptor subunit [Planctomycetota bacterium]|nr:efflux RND transporter periplasmic adaptor subunit [Planctomycetota bacterium]